MVVCSSSSAQDLMEKDPFTQDVIEHRSDKVRETFCMTQQVRCRCAYRAFVVPTVHLGKIETI